MDLHARLRHRSPLRGPVQVVSAEHPERPVETTVPAPGPPHVLRLTPSPARLSWTLSQRRHERLLRWMWASRSKALPQRQLREHDGIDRGVREGLAVPDLLEAPGLVHGL